MRIGIREQLAAVVLFTTLIPLMVLSVAVWVNNQNFVYSVTSNELSLTASLKASQISSDLTLIQSTCSTIVTRILLQSSLKRFYQGNTTESNWTTALSDIQSALNSGGFSSLLQATVFSRNATGSSPAGLIRATANNTGILLNTFYGNGTEAVLGDASSLGYPAGLYPNITYTPDPTTPDSMDPSINATLATAFADYPLNASASLILGPLQVNDSYALLSLTLPIIDNSDHVNLLGYMTVVAAASSLISVTQSREGLDKTGVVLLVGPSRRENLFKYAQRPSSANYTPEKSAIENAIVKFVFPPINATSDDRHTQFNANLSKYGSSNFTMRQFPAAVAGFMNKTKSSSNGGAMLQTHNEQNVSVAVGYARPQSTLVSWLLIIEQSHAEAFAPIRRLRNIVLACVFGTLAGVIIVVFPLAHYSVRPITRLRDATEKSIAPPGYTPNGSICTDRQSDDGNMSEDDGLPRPLGLADRRSSSNSKKSKNKGILIKLKRLTRTSRRKTFDQRHEDERRRVFKIPVKVRDRKHFVTDELTELTTTFNEMTDELMLQYTSLERKVAERTEELETSKRAAEAANESKTLFIANISHELKTPLNGILGMCAVCMSEDDLPKIKRSLGIVYKSGDLLLHLLNDLLLFSKNQIGQQLTLEQKEFRLVDIKTQIHTIFLKQVQEGNINFAVRFIGTDLDGEDMETSEKALPALGPGGIGRLKDMCLWGDQHRILQVIINLVSNSLKFTPEGGKVEVRIRCLGEAEPSPDPSRTSVGSKQSSQITLSQRTSRNRGRHGSGSNSSQVSRNPSNSKHPAGTALFINPMDPKAKPKVQVRERSPTPPPPGAKSYLFQFEVEDTGPGIPENLRETVFEPFVQGDLGLSKKYGGTGLGLSICSQLAGLMGGRIALASTAGVGSTFTMVIPLKYVKARAPSTSSSDAHGVSRAGSVSSTPARQDSVIRASSPEKGDTQPRLVGLSQPFFAAPTSSTDHTESPNQLAAIEKAAARKEPGSRLRVLVAEDNLVNQEVVLRMLKLEDIYDVVVAKDGQEAFDMVKASMSKDEYFDLIFMDIQMPNLDGLQSTRLIRQMGYSAPIVALTAFAEESNVKECYDSGMDMFLSKPIRRPALKQVLKKFATIPEESETGSDARKSSTTITRTSSESRGDSPRSSGKQPEAGTAPLLSHANGVTPARSPGPIS